MRRLRERQIVHLARPEGDGRTRTCCVVAVDRPSVALYPIAHEVRDGRGPEGEHYLAFDVEGRPVALRGLVRVVGDNDLRFEPNDGVQQPRRAASRLHAQAAFEIAVVDGGAPVTTTTIDFSADGALLEDPGLADVGAVVRFSFAPDAGAPIDGHADVVRRAGGQLALAFRALDAEGRRRIAEHVIAVKRAGLEREVERRLAEVA